MGYQFMRKMMLDQTWNHEKGYVKLLHYPSSELSKTFYLTAKNQSDFHLGILGELTQTTGNVTDVIRTVEKHFREVVHSFNDVNQIVEALCSNLDALQNNIKISFHLWARHKDLDYIPVISMGMPEMIVIPFDAEPYQSPNVKNQHLKCTFVPLALTKSLIFTTQASCLPKFTSKHESIFELSRHINDSLCQERRNDPDSNKEVSILLLDLHDFTVTSESTLYGNENFEKHIETIMSTINKVHNPFAIKLILSELLMNAFKHGNCVNCDLPIKVIVGINEEELVLEVMDMNIRMDEIPIKTDISCEDLLEENGRGLFLVNAFSDQFTIDNNSVISRIKCKKTNAQLN